MLALILCVNQIAGIFLGKIEVDVIKYNDKCYFSNLRRVLSMPAFTG